MERFLVPAWGKKEKKASSEMSYCSVVSVLLGAREERCSILRIIKPNHYLLYNFSKANCWGFFFVLVVVGWLVVCFFFSFSTSCGIN